MIERLNKYEQDIIDNILYLTEAEQRDLQQDIDRLRAKVKYLEERAG